MGLRSALGRALRLCFLFVINTSLWILAPTLARTSIPKEIETPRLWAPRYLSLRNSCWILGELSLRPSHRPGAVPRSSARCLAAPPARHSPAGETRAQAEPPERGAWAVGLLLSPSHRLCGLCGPLGFGFRICEVGTCTILRASKEFKNQVRIKCPAQREPWGAGNSYCLRFTSE